MAKAWPDKGLASEIRVMEANGELPPAAAAAAANQLPPNEQLAGFAKVLRQHDGGNQPA